MSYKAYKCKECGYEKEIDTNHYGECYSWGNYNTCPSCPPYKRPNTWVCIVVVPKDGWVPEPWSKVEIKIKKD
jgi:recombinational DNA repair protein RecR